jgi:hypothetical protein
LHGVGKPAQQLFFAVAALLHIKNSKLHLASTIEQLLTLLATPVKVQQHFAEKSYFVPK